MSDTPVNQAGEEGRSDQKVAPLCTEICGEVSCYDLAQGSPLRFQACDIAPDCDQHGSECDQSGLVSDGAMPWGPDTNRLASLSGVGSLQYSFTGVQNSRSPSSYALPF